MKKRLGEMLIEAGVIDDAQLQAALGHQRRWGGRLGQALVHLNLAPEADVVRALGRKFGFQSANLESLEPYALGQALALVPREVALRNHLLPMAADTTTITLAMSDPTNVAVIDEIGFRTGRRVMVRIAGEIAIADALKRHYPGPPALGGVEAIDLGVDGEADHRIDTLLDPFGGGSTDELEAFFSAQAEAAPAPRVPQATSRPAAAPRASAVRGAFPLELEEGTPANGLPVPPAPQAPHADGDAHEELTPLEELPADDLLLGDPLEPDPDAGSYFDAAPIDAGRAPEDPAPAPTAAPAQDRPLTDDEFAVLDALDRLAHGIPTEEPAVVKPAQLAAALVRLLIRKGVITDEEFLDELLRRQ